MMKKTLIRRVFVNIFSQITGAFMSITLELTIIKGV
jgi:hypothetical protein